MVKVVDSWLVILVVSFSINTAQASGRGESTSWDKTSRSFDSVDLAYSYCTPSSESQWILESAYGTGLKSTDALNTVTTYGFSSTGNTAGVSILEEDEAGAVSTETFYDIYNLERPIRIHKFLELLKRECVNCDFSLDIDRKAIKRSHPIKDLGEGNYWQLVDYIYLTNPSPHKKNIPVYVNFSYSVLGSSSSTNAMERFTNDDWNNADGLFRNYLKVHPNKL